MYVYVKGSLVTSMYHVTRTCSDDGDDNGPSNVQINAEDTSGSVPPSKDPARSAYSVELDDHDDDEGTLQARKSDLGRRDSHSYA